MADALKTPPLESHLLLRADRFNVERIGFDDLQGQRRWKDVIRHPGAAAILPVFDDGRICLIRNYRATVGETLLEIPAGTLDANETPIDCARRELQEETGLKAEKLESLGWFYLSPGIMDERMYLFVASGLQADSPNRMPDEQIENHIVNYEEALRMIQQGEIHDSKSIVALLRLPAWNPTLAG